MKNAGILLIIAALLISPVAASNAMGQFLAFGNPIVGDPAPDFALESLDGSRIAFSEFRASQPAIIFFWATWCPHCRTELQTLALKKTEFERKGIRLVLVDLEEPADAVKDYLSRNGIDYNVLLDSDSKVAGQYFLVGVPTFVFVGSDGVVRAVEHALPPNYEGLLENRT